jgi:hypothetical protein
MDVRRWVAGCSVVAIGAAVLPVVLASPAVAVANPTIVVTTTADVVNAGDGVVSLREAVALANATAGDDTIALADGATYDLTICGPSNDFGSDNSPDNSIGDLNATDTSALTISGDSAAVTPPVVNQTCPQRVIYGSAGPLTLQYLHVTGGHGDQGGSIRAGGPLVFDHVDQSGAASGSFSSPDGAVHVGDSPLSIIDSAIHDNTETGLYLSSAGTRESRVIRRTSIRDNAAGDSAAGGIYTQGPITIDQSQITGNSSRYLGGISALGAYVTSSVISGNQGNDGGGILGAFTLVDSRVTDNRVTHIGGGGSGFFTIVRSTVTGNHSAFSGGGLYGSGTITDSTVSGNDSGAAGGGIDIEAPYSGPAGPSLVMRRSTVTGNRGAVAGGIAVFDDWADNPTGPPGGVHRADLVVESSTVSGNSLVSTPSTNPMAPDPPPALDLAFGRWRGEPAANVVGRLDLVSSVVGSGGSVVPGCSLAAASPVVSGGHNFSPDGSCGVGAGAGDVNAGGDPGLSVLADHGGPTLTMMPTVGSALIDRIPSGFSTCAGQLDQRGVARPVGGSCDIGAVEADSGVFPPEREFTPIVPQRLMDTRADPAYHVGPQHRFGPNGQQSLVVTGSTVPADATAVVVNVTAVGPSDASHLDVWPAGSPQPNVSNLNFVAGQTVPNLVEVKVGAGGRISMFNRNGSVDVIVDVVGFYRADPSAARFTPIVPKRVADTRADPIYHVGPLSRLGDHNDPRVLTVTSPPTIPADAVAVVANVTVVDPTVASHLDLWPQGAAAKPNVSNLNYSAGQTVANLVVVKLSASGNGQISLENQNGSVDVIVDVVGYFTVDPSAAGFVATNPQRLADTRADPAYHVGAQSRFGDRTDTRTFVVTGGAVPADARAIVANVTVVGPSAASHLDVWPAGAPKPTGSNINYLAGQTVPNLVTVKIGPGGAIALQNQNGATDVIIDIVGYYR